MSTDNQKIQEIFIKFRGLIDELESVINENAKSEEAKSKPIPNVEMPIPGSKALNKGGGNIPGSAEIIG